LDIALAWLYHADTRWLRIERVAGHIYIGLTFISSTVFLKHGFINVIGIILTASVIICLSMRFDARRGIHAKRSAVTG
jgi:CHASE2 domain-containing sensor protein